MTDETQRLNQRRFTDTASDYAAGRAAAREAQAAALFALARPASADVVIDVACGPGALLAALGPRVGRAVGLDVTPAMLGLARRAAPAALLVRGDAGALPFAGGAFSLVTCTSALHHFADPDRVLGEMARVCRRGGRVVVADLVASANPDARRLQNEIEHLRDPAHVAMDSRVGWADRLQRAGLARAEEIDGIEPRDIDEWCAMAKTPPDVASRVRELLLSTQPGDRANMNPAVDATGRLGFVHHWAILAARKP